MTSTDATAHDLGTPLDHRYARDLPDLCVPWQPSPAPAPRWLRFNHGLATSLGLDAERLAGDEGLAMFSGQRVPLGAQPVAQAYAGHQFGGYSPRLGDGRALLLGEVIDPRGQRHDVAFKGSGRTPFSRGGDGKAAVGPVLREYLISEAMHALGIPTTRTLAAVATGETIQREQGLPGAVMTRTAASHIRVGTFQFAANGGDIDTLKRLLTHTIDRHDPALAEAPQPALALLQAVMQRQADLVAQWMGVGFIHGVMNTDNMTLSGETIDYGPCAFMEAHHPDTVFSSIDHHGRYAYGNQPGIAQWNLARLAEALLPLIDSDSDAAVEQATALINTYPAVYERAWLRVFRAKLGLVDTGDAAGDRQLAQDFLQWMTTHQIDHTLGFVRLTDWLTGDEADASVSPWLQRWRQRLWQQPGQGADATACMQRVNPVVIPRNHRVEAALDAASQQGDLQPFEALLAAIQAPFDADQRHRHWAQPATPAQAAGYQTFCGT